MSLKDKIDIEKLPRHIAIIMDGNGRWAERRGNERVFGHKNGVKAVRETVEAAAELGVDYLTLYAFSTENWSRPRTEVDALMSLLVITLDDELETLMKNNIRLMTIGDTDSLPSRVNKHLKRTMKITSGNTGLKLILALSYSARWEIVEAVRKIARQVENGEISAEDVSYDYFTDCLLTKDIPDPELLIRTSGENRISNFLLWQIAYTELYFTQTLWPDFRKEDLYEAICNFQNRERRFGMISEQVVT
ncbi:MAG: isoprenyl transferase [Bacteroidales bacterium]|nr:isoprenyl transferase [Bacteroidales bacterium]